MGELDFNVQRIDVLSARLGLIQIGSLIVLHFPNPKGHLGLPVLGIPFQVNREMLLPVSARMFTLK